MTSHLINDDVTSQVKILTSQPSESGISWKIWSLLVALEKYSELIENTSLTGLLELGLTSY